MYLDYTNYKTGIVRCVCTAFVLKGREKRARIGECGRLQATRAWCSCRALGYIVFHKPYIHCCWCYTTSQHKSQASLYMRAFIPFPVYLAIWQSKVATACWPLSPSAARLAPYRSYVCEHLKCRTKKSFSCFVHPRITIQFHLEQLEQGVATDTEDGDQDCCSIRWPEGMLTNESDMLTRPQTLCAIYRGKKPTHDKNLKKRERLPKSWKSKASQNAW